MFAMLDSDLNLMTEVRGQGESEHLMWAQYRHRSFARGSPVILKSSSSWFDLEFDDYGSVKGLCLVPVNWLAQSRTRLQYNHALVRAQSKGTAQKESHNY